MKNNKGVTLVSLVITIIVLIIISGITANVSNDVIKQARLQDLKTNMLLIQAKAKTLAEEVNFETANLDKTKETDLTKINEIKGTKLIGTALDACEEAIKTAASNAGVTDATDFYYLSQENLSQMGINIEVPEDTYYLVKYNFEDTEVVFTGGYKYEDEVYYKLSELNNIEQ